VLPALLERGIPALYISYRNDPEAPQTEDRLAHFGAEEWEDLAGAVRFAIGRGAEDVVLVGYSMGGAVAMAFLTESDLAPEVRALVMDAPALELGAMIDAEASDRRLPLLPLPIPVPLTATAKMIAGWRFGVDWGELDYVAKADRLDIPVLVLHGNEDDTVPLEISERFAAARPDLVELEVFDGAGHVRSWNVDQDRYLKVVGEFLDRVAPGS
jgi:alpha-beta hydrolase superfamily lysophospholipase